NYAIIGNPSSPCEGHHWKAISSDEIDRDFFESKRLESNFHQEQRSAVFVPKAGQSPSGDPLPETSFGMQPAKQCPVCSCLSKGLVHRALT
ncbi:MAG: hypothetical protein ACE5FF_09580, partial [Saprospiraceae bacterium]